MIKLNFEYVNNSGEWEKTSVPCESQRDAELKTKTINRSDRKRNPVIENI